MGNGNHGEPLLGRRRFVDHEHIDDAAVACRNFYVVRKQFEKFSRSDDTEQLRNQVVLGCDAANLVI